MRKLFDWWNDLTSLLTDPQVLMAAVVLGAVLALGALAAYSVWRWRVEKAIVETELRNVRARVHHYATVCPDSESSTLAARTREYLGGTVDRWMRLRCQRYTDFQIFLALRAIRGMDSPEDPWLEQLAAGFQEALLATVNPRMNLVSAVVNNALATAVGIRPFSARPPVTLPAEADAPELAYVETLDLEVLLSRPDPFDVEREMTSDERDPLWLHHLLEGVGRANLHPRVPPSGEDVRALMVEMVIWIVHEELIGPAPLSAELLNVYEVSPQLLAIPDWLRGSRVGAIQRLGVNELAIVLREARLPSGTRFNGSFSLPAPLHAEGLFWHFNRMEYDVTRETARLFFEGW